MTMPTLPDCALIFLFSVSPQALWMMEPKEISDWQHEEFYRYVAQTFDKPRYTLHYRADAPLNIRSIFYVPEAVSGGQWSCLGGVRVRSSPLTATCLRTPPQKPTMFDVSREMGSSVALYSRKVLIQTKATDILPKWLRFLRGADRSEPPRRLVSST